MDCFRTFASLSKTVKMRSSSLNPLNLDKGKINLAFINVTLTCHKDRKKSEENRDKVRGPCKKCIKAIDFLQSCSFANIKQHNIKHWVVTNAAAVVSFCCRCKHVSFGWLCVEKGLYHHVPKRLTFQDRGKVNGKITKETETPWSSQVKKWQHIPEKLSTL